jgi:hypothetical protein
MLKHTCKIGQELMIALRHLRNYSNAQVIFPYIIIIIEAIHEIRSKVILYKEFMKLLYEEDPSRE